jgi:hypothetical protein
MRCYTKSPELVARLKAHNDAIKIPNSQCQNCGKEIVNRRFKRIYCSDGCRRAYFAARFDRFVANPEQLALPQCYDEFLTKEELPCLVDGCDWHGVRLAHHCNVVHGIDARTLKKLAGFNLSTGLVPPAVKQAMSERAIREGLPEHAMRFQPGHVFASRDGYRSLEEKEHGIKVRTVLKTVPPDRPARACRQCGTPVAQPYFGIRLYCSTKCRIAYYAQQGKEELSCAHCGTRFIGNRAQVLRSNRGLLVCCSADCRNQLNMATCLATRRRKKPAKES